MDGARLDYAQFLHALVKIALRVFPPRGGASGPGALAEAIVWLLRDHLLPLAGRVERGEAIGEPPTPSGSPRMAALIEELKDRLRVVFEHYCVGGRAKLRLADLSQLVEAGRP